MEEKCRWLVAAARGSCVVEGGSWQDLCETRIWVERRGWMRTLGALARNITGYFASHGLEPERVTAYPELKEELSGNFRIRWDLVSFRCD